MKALTTSMQRYIHAIYELSSNHDGVRVSDIAAKLGITKASTCMAMKNLQAKGWIYRDDLRRVLLTEAGHFQAVSMLDKYAILFQFLTEVLKVEPETAAADAHAMEYILSINTICAICHFRQNAEVEHGCPKFVRYLHHS